VLAQQDLQHQAVYRVVFAIVGDDANYLGRLPIAVHPAFSLLMPSRVPGKVVVNNRVKELLQVDALT
jgi:hypothetical protein